MGQLSSKPASPEKPKSFFSLLGPGFIAGASDDDPSGIGTYISAGAAFGYATLWIALITYPLMCSIQYICAKVGKVSGEGLSAVMRRHYSGWILYPTVLALFFANTINAGADIGAIAEAVRLFVPIPAAVLIIAIAAIILAIQVLGSYKLVSRIFKWLALALVTYIGSALLCHPKWGRVLHGTFIPEMRWDADFLSMVVALLGTTISPYLFFFQASQEVEHEISQGRTVLWQRRGTTDEELRYAAMDVNIGMLFSNLIMYFIILATAGTLYQAGQHNVESATVAAQALRPLAGEGASVLLALGLIGSGFLAVPVLTGSAAYALCGAFDLPRGMDTKWHQAREFYTIIFVSTGLGVIVNFLGINPIRALYWAAVLNGVLAVPLLVIIMRITNNPKVMEKWVNPTWLNVLGWITTILMGLAAVAMFITSAQ